MNAAADEDLITLFNDPTRREEAAAAICQRFLNQLLPLIRANLSDRIRPRVDEEDVLQSVWASFFRREFTIENADQLFNLLATISVRKARDAGRRQTAQKRDVSAEDHPDKAEKGRKPIPDGPMRLSLGERVHETALYEPDSDIDEDSARQMLKGALPEHALVALEILERMPSQLRAILVMRLQNMTESEIATQLKCTRRTVTRRLAMIREWMRSEIDES